MEEEPALKRAKITTSPESDNWIRWHSNLQRLQSKLLSGCLCNVDVLELQRPLPCNLDTENSFPEEYTLQFISTLNLLISVALNQHGKGFICRRVLHIAADVSSDECIWELLLESLNSQDKFTSYAASKTLTNFLLWTKLPNLDEIFNDLFTQILSDTCDSTPQKLSHLLDTIRGVIDYKEEDDHPLEVGLEGTTQQQACSKVEMDSEIETDVKNLCVKALENWWMRLVTKFHNLLSNYDEKYEAPALTFLSLWQSVVSVKTNLSVIETKHFHLQLQSFVPHLNVSLPAVLWKKILDLFSEILCYGSTLSLQDCLADEPCDLAHLILRCVKNRQFLAGVPYTKHFSGFGGSSVGAADWEWKSSNSIMISQTTSMKGSSFSRNYEIPGPSHRVSQASRNTTRNFDMASSSLAGSSNCKPGTSRGYCEENDLVPKAAKVTKFAPEAMPNNTIYIGPCQETPALDDVYVDTGGDRTLLQKLVLVVLKSVAVTVKETREDSDSDESNSNSSGSESDGGDMLIIERSIREVFQQVDSFIKSLLPFHPATPLGEWIVKLFADQDDALVEAMLCALDTFTGFHGRIQTPEYLRTTLDPVVTFNSFATTVSQDKDVLLDLLMSNETCFLLYFLRYLKFCWRNWKDFVESCGRDFEKVMGLFIRLRISVGRLVEKSLFPYNINPVLRLLERCEQMYETSCKTK